MREAMGEATSETIGPSDARLREALEEVYRQGEDAPDELEHQLQRYTRCIEAFRRRFAQPDAPTAGRGARTKVGAQEDASEAAELQVYRAPGRTELSGNHTDHNGGFVLAAAVHLDCVAVVRPRADMTVRVVSEGHPEVCEVGLISLDPVAGEEGRLAGLVRGVGSAVREQGRVCGGFDAYLDSAIPVGSGLSSSAAVEVLLAEVQNTLYNDRCIDTVTLAKIGRRAENRHFGKPCGLMDQLACAGGGISGIDLADHDAPVLHRLAGGFTRHGMAVVIVSTGGSHADLTEDYAAVPREMLAVASELGGRQLRDLSREAVLGALPELRARCGDRAVLRALHFFDESERARLQYRALEQGDLDEYLRLARESGASSWCLLQNAATPQEPREQGIPLALALTERYLRRRGIRNAASRVHGGGFAGTIQVYLPLDEFEPYKAEIERVFGAGAAVRVRTSDHGTARVI